MARLGASILAVGCLTLAGAPAFAQSPVALDEAVKWQPPGGAYKFQITPAPPAGADNPKAFLCPDQTDPALLGADNAARATVFTDPADARYPKADIADACLELTVQRLAESAEAPQSANYQATIPLGLGKKFTARSNSYYSGFADTPLNPFARLLLTSGHLRIQDGGASPAWFEVGITSRKYAMFLTLLSVALVALALLVFAKRLAGLGPRATWRNRLLWLPLTLISRPNGRASLSKLQILLWTFVVGGGAVYVVALNGALIAISAGTLLLLGIAGGTAVLAGATDDRTDAAARPPGKPRNVAVRTAPGRAELFVSWSPPLDPAPITHYLVRYRSVDDAGAARTDATADAGEVVSLMPSAIRLVGLRGLTRYRVSVAAVNATTSGEAEPDAAAPAVMTGPSLTAEDGSYLSLNLHARLDQLSENTVALEWTPAEGDPDFFVQYRRLDSLEDWRDVITNGSRLHRASATISRLESGATYQFSLRRNAPGALWSPALAVTTLHVPRWSDLVTDPNRPTEIDVSRVQMLVFTAITAAFVCLKIADLGAIPTIPPEYVYLMGISNSVYLTTKFVRR